MRRLFSKASLCLLTVYHLNWLIVDAVPAETPVMRAWTVDQQKAQWLKQWQDQQNQQLKQQQQLQKQQQEQLEPDDSAFPGDTGDTTGNRPSQTSEIGRQTTSTSTSKPTSTPTPVGEPDTTSPPRDITNNDKVPTPTTTTDSSLPQQSPSPSETPKDKENNPENDTQITSNSMPPDQPPPPPPSPPRPSETAVVAPTQPAPDAASDTESDGATTKLASDTDNEQTSRLVIPANVFMNSNSASTPLILPLQAISIMMAYAAWLFW